MMNSKGETLIETLCALLIVTLSVTFLVTSIVTAARINRKVREKDTAFTYSETYDGEGTVNVEFQDEELTGFSIDIYNYSTENGYSYYEGK